MNDPKDILVSIENIKEENSKNQSVVEEVNENNEIEEIQTEESRLDILLYHVYENFGKRFYK